MNRRADMPANPITERWEALAVGERFVYRDTDCEKLGESEDTSDRFGQPLRRFWARRFDTDAEGWIVYGLGYSGESSLRSAA